MKHIAIVFESNLNHSILFLGTKQQLTVEHEDALTSNFVLKFLADDTIRMIDVLVLKSENHN